MKKRNIFKRIFFDLFHFLFRYNHRKEDYVAIIFRHHPSTHLLSFSANELFDISKILGTPINYPTVLHQENSFYGTEFSLNDFSGHQKPVKACIEHGIYFGSYVNERECFHSGFPALITFSSVRKEHIRTVSRIPVIEVGPYIAYASSLLDNTELVKRKRLLGKTLLVFPSHSTDYAQATFDSLELIKEIGHLQKEQNYQTVLVNLFWKDIANHQDQIFRDAGFQVTCCGVQNDPFFLRRLRSLILLSDMTMSNSVSTNLGYCIFLGKPHYFYRQKMDLLHAKSSSGEYLPENIRTREEEKEDIISHFCVFSPNISSLQWQICSKYWGFDKVVTKECLMDLFSFLDLVDEKAHRSQKRFAKVFEEEVAIMESGTSQEKIRSSLK